MINEKKKPYAAKIQRLKAYQLIFVSLVAFDGFHLLLSTQLTADLTLEWSGRSIFHPLSYIYAKTPFCCVETVANNTLNRRRVVVFHLLWANAAPTFNTAFALTNVHAEWWLLIYSLPLPSHFSLIIFYHSVWLGFELLGLRVQVHSHCLQFTLVRKEYDNHYCHNKPKTGNRAGVYMTSCSEEMVLGIWEFWKRVSWKLRLDHGVE